MRDSQLGFIFREAHRTVSALALSKGIPVLVVLVSFLLLGCAGTTRKLMNLQLGMTKPEVTEAMGEPAVIRSAFTVNDDEQVIEIWEYDLYKAGLIEIPDTYWLCFSNGLLIQWGRAYDRQFYDIRFR